MKPPIDSLILTVRDQKVILDADLAELYGVLTKVLNQAVKRNAGRFPEDFCFRLSEPEWDSLKCQIGISSSTGSQPSQKHYDGALRSQFVTLKTGRGQHRKYLPYAFNEHGALMAANVLNSPEAAKMSVYIVRAFIKQRALLASHADVLKKLAQMDAKLLQHDDALRIIWQELQPLLNPPPASPKPRIGFDAREDSPTYGGKRRKMSRPAFQPLYIKAWPFGVVSRPNHRLLKAWPFELRPIRCSIPHHSLQCPPA